MEKSRSTDSDPFTRALRILGRRDHSEAELRRKLERFGFSASAIDSAVERCYHYDYLDDQRYALARCREMLRNGRGVGPRILLDLRRRGLNEKVAREALESAAKEFSDVEVFQQQLERRFHGFDYTAASDKERRRVVSYFQRRGFQLSVIFSELKK